MNYEVNLIIDNFIIDTPVIEILKALQTDPFNTNGYLKHINDKQEYVQITCPFHKDGHETRPSASVYALKGKKIGFGKLHCFTCHAVTDLVGIVKQVLSCSEEEAKNWLIENFASAKLEENYMPEFTRKQVEFSPVQAYLDESILNEYNYWHPYMEVRHLTKEVVQQFKIGYDIKTQCITFPAWDASGGLVMITKRSVNTKQFYIPKNVQKPIYLLNFILAKNIKAVVVCESQLDALTLWGWHIPAIALFGTGAEHQYEILKHTDIRSYHLALDGDAAGENGCHKFKKAMGKNVLIDRIAIPNGKDVNDLTEREFRALPLLW